jgi:dolichol-phosphate mannosyltransferase
MNDSIVIIPTYNEIENVEKIIRATLSQHKSFHILIIDDNSPDHTADKVALLQEEYPGRLFLEKRKEKSGLGTAYVHGFKWALQHKYQFIFEMDADFSHDPKDLPRLYAATHDEGNDVAVGSRYVSGVNTELSSSRNGSRLCMGSTRARPVHRAATASPQRRMLQRGSRLWADTAPEYASP